MKRNREDMVTMIDQLRDKRRRLDASIREWERDLKAHDREEALARARTIPWNMYKHAAIKSKKAWKKVAPTEPGYSELTCDTIREIATEACPAQGIYYDSIWRLTTLNDEAPVHHLCNFCVLDAETKEGVLLHTRDMKEHGVKIDPVDYEPDLLVIQVDNSDENE